MAMPTSNVGGNNQTSPGVGGVQPIAQLPFQGPAQQGQNPFFNSAPVGTPSPSSPTLPTSGPVPLGTGTTSGNFPTPTNTNPLITNNSSYSSGSHAGENDLEKQLIDMYGKGVGGSLFSMLAGMGGQDSAIFQQFLSSMGPMWAQQKASLGQGLGAGGVSANSSVNAIGQSTLAGQQQATAAGVDAQLMSQEMQDTMSVLMGTRGDAAKEVSQSGWSVFADVLQTGAMDAINAFAAYEGGSPSFGSNPNYNNTSGMGTGDSASNAPQMQNVTAPGQLPSFNPGQADPSNYNDPYWQGMSSNSIFADGGISSGIGDAG